MMEGRCQMQSWSSSHCSRSTGRGGTALVALTLVIASACGSEVEPASTAAPPVPEESVRAVQPSTPAPTDSLDVGSDTIASLPPGPDVGDLVSMSTTDLVIVKPRERDDVLRAAISELGGEIHFDSEQLGLYGARFETATAATLAEVRDELRRRGFDASIDIESDDPTTG